MRSWMTPWAASLTLALVPLVPQGPAGSAGASAQTPKPEGLPSRARTDPAARALDVHASMLGAWQLTKGEIPDLGTTGSGVVGYALFLDGYMSCELHVFGNTGGDSEDVFFQTGTHRWKLDERLTMETYSLIGTHNVTEDEEYDFEQPGERRTYRVGLEGDTLVLERPDRTARLTFRRLGKLRYPDGGDAPTTDFYGRPVQPKPATPPAKRPGGNER